MLFIVAFCAVSGVYAYALGPAQQRLVVASTATNLANLRNDPLGTMIASVFVAEAEPWLWVAFAALGLFPVAHRFGNVRTLVLVGAAQVIGTLISEGLLAWRISAGVMPTSARYVDDVGPSYVVASALIATILYGAVPLMRTARHGHWLFDRIPSRWWRICAGVGLAFLAPHLFYKLDRLDVAAVGHVVALLVGAGVGLLFVRRERTRIGLCGAGPRTDLAPAPRPQRGLTHRRSVNGGGPVP
jgi:hypothetical protein